MLDTQSSHKPAKVFTFLPDQRPDLILQLRELKFDEDDKLSENYKNICWDDFEAISLYLREDQIIGFSSVWHRPEYYESGEVRILNRYWESPNMRRTSKIIGDTHLIEMITQQLYIAKYLGFNTAFISREKTPKYFKRLITNIDKETNIKWFLEPKKVCVCVPEAPSCWQYKAWTNL